MNNHDYYPQNPPEPEKIEYMLSQSLETDPNEISIYTIEEHLYEQKKEDDFTDFEEIRIKELIQSSDNLELIKNESRETAFIL